MSTKITSSAPYYRSNSLSSHIQAGLSQKNLGYVRRNLDRMEAGNAKHAKQKKIFQCPIHDLYDIFLSFKTPLYMTAKVAEEFRAYKRSGLHVPFAAIIIVFIFYFGTRGSSEYLLTLVGSNAAFLAAAVAGCCTILSIIFLIFNHLALLSLEYHITCLQYFHASAVSYSQSPWSQLVEDSAVLCSAAMTSLYVLGHVLTGPCDPYTYANRTQRCNPDAESHSLPGDQLAVVFLSVLLMQVFIKGCSTTSIIISLSINVAVINLCLVLVGSQSFGWTNALFLLAAAVSYEIERTTLRLFLHQKIASNERNNYCFATWAANEAILERDIVTLVNCELQGTISNSAHDLKSPCTALGLGIECLLKNLKHQQKEQPSGMNTQNFELARGMYQTLIFMGMSINRSMDYAKSACGFDLLPTISTLNPLECVKKIVEYVMWDESIDASFVRITPLQPDFPLEGLTDIVWFQENVSCLLRNAVKYSIHSSERSSVSIEMRMATVGLTRVAEFSVTDSGPSLSSEQLARLFDPPAQSKRLQVGGMGLGLVCLAERVKVLGGECGARVRSDKNSGSVVWFSIPFSPISPTVQSFPSIRKQSVEIPDLSSVKSLALGSNNADQLIVSGLSILLADDAVTILKMASYILTKAGAKVAQARNGQEAVEKTKLFDFDVIITDIQMPVLDGFEATKAIRDMERASGSRPKIIIGISASSEGMFCEKAAAWGMDAFLPKPFKLNDLVDTLRELADAKLKRGEIAANY